MTVDIVTIDFETYYDREYSLSKITTEAYVRSPQFEVIGVGVKVNDGPVDTYSGNDVGKFLKSLDYTDKAILCHNTMFDGAILSWHFGIKPKLWLDTLSMARPLHQATVGGSLKALAQFYGLGQKGEEVIAALGKRRSDFTPVELAAYMKYCANDIDLTYALFKKLRKGFPVAEMRVIDATIRMYTEPMVELDAGKLASHLVVVQAEKQTLLDSLGGKGKDYIMSNDKFAKLLRRRGVEPPTKVSTKTGKETYAFAKTDLDFLALQDHHDPVVQTLVSARLGLKSTLEETRTARFMAIAGRGRLPIALSYYGAHTGRFSGCLTGDTVVTVLTPAGYVVGKPITEVLLDELVWDGVEFVEHDGVAFSGYQEVIEWDGVRGTEDHVVYTEDGEISLADAKAHGSSITTADRPSVHAVDSARAARAQHKG